MSVTPEETFIDFDITPKQGEMMHKYADVDEIFYGGQAGGGKSEGLLMFALRRRLDCPNSVGLMLRRSFRELEKSLIRKSKRYYHHFAKWNEAKKLWKFKPQFGGGIQEFGYCENDKDVEQYQSAEYDDICVDELGHWTEYAYLYLQSRLRPQGEWKGLMRSAGNPGGIGHLWIKDRFVSQARDHVVSVWDDEEGTFKTRLFIPSALGDNTLMSKQKRASYRAWLNNLPEAEKKQLRDGDWDYMPGAAFPELTRQTHAYERDKHPVPDWATICMSFDFGFGKPFSVGWYWIDYDGRGWRFAEWYGWNGKANQGMRMAPSQIAKGILEREEKMGIEGRCKERKADPACFNKTPNLQGGGQGPSVAEIMAEHGVSMIPADNHRLLGKQQLHERFRITEAVDETQPLPMLMVANECTNWWRTMPALPIDEDDIEDVDTDAEDHNYDETRYWAMGRPLSPQHKKPEESHIEKIIKRVKTASELLDAMEPDISSETEETAYDMEGL